MTPMERAKEINRKRMDRNDHRLELDNIAAEFDADRIAFGEKVLEMAELIVYMSPVPDPKQYVFRLDDKNIAWADATWAVIDTIRALKPRLPELAKE